MKYIRITFTSAKLPYYKKLTKDGVDKFVKPYKLSVSGKETLTDDYTKFTDKVTNEIHSLTDLLSGGSKSEKRPVSELISNKDCGNPFGTVRNLIHYEQVSNMLHVFVGERPVSSFHTPKVDGVPIRKRNQLLDEIAKNGMVKLNNTYFYKKDDEYNVITEVTSFKKTSPSNVKCGNVSWRKFKNRFFDNPEKLEHIVETFGKYTEKPFNESNYASVSEAIAELNRNGRYSDFVNDSGYKGFNNDNCSFHKVESDGNGVRTARFVRMSINSSPFPMVSLSGEFRFCVPDDLYNRILTGTKCATYLDGGVALLEKWEDDNSYSLSSLYDTDDIEYLFSEEGFEKISEIDVRY